MANRPDLDDDDDDFSEIYKAYTGPGGGSSSSKVQENTDTNKRPLADSDEENEELDPNAVPTDFTSREAKLWDAKSKATERNWKKRKEEEMICKICGESGHYTQGCPSTLGANSKSQDFFERVPARDKRVKALFTEKVIGRIEKETGCKIRMNEKFLFVHGKEGSILAKGADAVHKLIKEEVDKGPGSPKQNSDSPERIHLSSRTGHPEQRSYSNSRNASESPQRFGRHAKIVEDCIREDIYKPARNSPQRFGRQDRSVEDGIREDLYKPSRNSPQRFGRRDRSVEAGIREDLYKPSRSSPQRFGRQDRSVEDGSREDVYKSSRNSQGYGIDGARGRSTRSKSPVRHPYSASGNSYSSKESHRHSMVSSQCDGWKSERRGPEVPSDTKFERPSFQASLEELEMEYRKEAVDLGKIRDQQEDEENCKHRETTRGLSESYMKKVTEVRSSHAKQWEEFLQMDAQKRQLQLAQQLVPSSGYGGSYKQSSYSNYDNPINQSRFSGGVNHLVDSRGRYLEGVETYSHPASREVYGEYQRQRIEEYGRTFTRY